MSVFHVSVTSYIYSTSAQISSTNLGGLGGRKVTAYKHNVSALLNMALLQDFAFKSSNTERISSKRAES